jgi:hypothetical protein
MKTVRDACELQPNALSIKLSDQIEQLDGLIHAEGNGAAFFDKTHITQGMQALISEGIARLAGASSQTVFHLKQAMGGGKTHLLGVTIVLKAELRGLLSQAHPESIHDRIENILTSNVFGIFSYLDPNEALLPFLRTASDAGLKPMEVPERCVRVLWRFWPRLQRDKIPDVLLVIESPEVDYVIAIEAKYCRPA